MHHREQRTEGCGHPFQALHAAFVRVYAGLKLREPTGLAYAHELFHLRFEDAEFLQDFAFEVCHLVSFPTWVMSSQPERHVLVLVTCPYSVISTEA
jgi:hypothetical protein